MRRRSFLAAALAGTAGLAGCSGLTGDGSDRDPYGVPATDTPTETETTPDDPPDDPPDLLDDPSLVVDLDVGPRTYALPGFFGLDRPGIGYETGFTRTATADHPASLTTVVTNDRNVPAILDAATLPTLVPSVGYLRDDGRRGEGGGSRDGDGPALALVPTERDELALGTGGFERAGTYWTTTDYSGDWYPDVVRIDPDDAVVIDQAVVGRRGSEGRPTGTYEFGAGEGALPFVVWNTDRPGPTADSRFDGVDVGPPGVRSVRWFHDAGPTAGRYLFPAVERTDLPAKITFEFVNHTREEASLGDWYLHKRVDDRWFRVDGQRRRLGSGFRFLAPGGTAEWTLHAFPDEGLDCDCAGEMAQFLGGGRYAVTVGYDSRTEAGGALFEVRAEPTTVRPAEDATVEREGSTAVVTSPAFDADPESRVRVVVERAGPVGDSGGVERRVIPEQAMQPSRTGLRNALGAFEEGIDRVHLLTTDVLAPSARSLGFEGTRYEVSVEAP